jgi:hypothetical protein
MVDAEGEAKECTCVGHDGCIDFGHFPDSIASPAQISKLCCRFDWIDLLAGNFACGLTVFSLGGYIYEKANRALAGILLFVVRRCGYVGAR